MCAILADLGSSLARSTNPLLELLKARSNNSSNLLSFRMSLRRYETSACSIRSETVKSSKVFLGRLHLISTRRRNLFCIRSSNALSLTKRGHQIMLQYSSMRYDVRSVQIEVNRRILNRERSERNPRPYQGTLLDRCVHML